MCLILFAYQVHPTYKLIVAANRDEFYGRPTAPAHYWEDHPHILAGRDLEKMGTWMGVTKEGRFAALTNYRNPDEKTEGKHSRGELVADVLNGNESLEHCMRKVETNRQLYPGYNLLAGDANELYHYSNIENKLHKLAPGIYGVSNHLLNTDWPKVKRGKAGLSKIISQNDESIVEQLLNLLQNTDPSSDEILPSTGVSLEWERVLSPVFIQSESYGTRSSTVLLMTDEEIHYKERVYGEGGIDDREYTINLKN
ncbi:NRDE family protein [Peribacillus cavernae]|uniref:NRDE family protein n=1 Tax=Peribacillus cavernae TaxID=1674310 RepID=A0A3S1B5A2_9BACI|nr:NRDE family protein [Peribacillus cavernae]RUQ28854.1 NRDE family protein [Peribacillus cavernae]